MSRQVWQVIADTDDSRRGRLIGPAFDVPCALGRGGYIDAAEKREGDGKTPLGIYPLRQVFYRPDRIAPPLCKLPLTPLSPTLGWCDDASHVRYNQLVTLPFSASHEKMWRKDGLYDLVLAIGHNDDPPIPGYGSAIFVHVARTGFAPTEGCVALAQQALVSFLRMVRSDDMLKIG